MEPNFRELCARMADELADFQWAVIEAGVGWACPDTESLINRARAALAEPETEGPTDEGLLSLDQLRDAWNAWADAVNSWDELGIDEIVWWAQRQALARWGRPTPQPEPEGPTDEEVEAWVDQQGFIRGHGDHPCGFWIDDGDAGVLVRAALARWGTPSSAETRRSVGEQVDGEVAELVAWLRQEAAEYHRYGDSLPSDMRDNLLHASARCTRAADLLALQQPQPVPVSERPWEREGWCDEKGQCWWFNPGQPAMSNPHIATSSWRLCRMLNGKPMGSYSLPASALPLPGEVER